MLQDYYPAELPLVLQAYAGLYDREHSGAQPADPMTFFGTGGERIDV